MTTELLTLLLATLLCLLLPAVYGTMLGSQIGLGGLMGNREGLGEPSGAAGRGYRAHRNLLENLAPYAVVVLTAHVLGVSNGVTVTASVVFLIARLVHAASYLAGIPVVRTLSYAAGLVATLTIMFQVMAR
jgi:uncharacterized MAPEG superfamily protein